MTVFARRSLTPILGVLIALLAVRFVLMLPGAATRRSDGFAAYYTAARLLRENDHVATFYDDQWFNTQVGRIVPGIQDIFRPNTPPAVALMLPLARFAYRDARILWTIFKLVLLAATLAIIVRESAFPLPLALAFVALTLFFEPLWVDLRQGQAYILLLFLSTVCWVAFRRRNDRTAGIALGLMLVFKTAGVLLPLLLLRRKRWRALASCLATVGLVVVTSLITLGAAPWHTYLELLWRGRNEPDLMVTAYQSAYSFSHHLFVYDAIWNAQPVFRQPQFGAALALVSVLLVLIVTGIILARDSSDDRSFAALMTAAIVLSPYSLAYHYCLMLLPIAIIGSHFEHDEAPWNWLILTVSAMLIAAPFPYLSPHLREGAWALLAYPKLYGALCLLGLTLWESMRESTADVSAAAVVNAAAMAWSDA